MHIRTSYGKAFESYRLRDIQTYMQTRSFAGGQKSNTQGNYDGQIELQRHHGPKIGTTLQVKIGLVLHMRHSVGS